MQEHWKDGIEQGFKLYTGMQAVSLQVRFVLPQLMVSAASVLGCMQLHMHLFGWSHMLL